MRIDRLQAIVSVLIIATFVAVTAIIALTPVVGGYPTDVYTEHLKTFASLYSGIVGLIVGFYFGKSSGADGGV